MIQNKNTNYTFKSLLNVFSGARCMVMDKYFPPKIHGITT